MKQLDTIKLSLLLLAILIWFEGMRLGSRNVMTAGVAVVVVAFLLRFVKRPPTEPPAPRA